MTKAIILAAGTGSRLRPITNDKPKCLVSLMGKSLLDHQIGILRSKGITEVHIATGYQSEMIKELGFNTSLNENFATTNMVESLLLAYKCLENCDEDLIVSYGDIVYQGANLEALLSCNDEIAVMVDEEWQLLWSLRFENPLDDAETLVMDNDRYILEIGQKPRGYSKIHAQYTGLIKIRRDKISEMMDIYANLAELLEFESPDYRNICMTSFLQILITQNWKVRGVIVEGGWLEVDSLSDLKVYSDMHAQGLLANFFQPE